MAADYRKLVKDILTNAETKKVVIHLPDDVDVSKSEDTYKKIHAALLRNNAAYATVRVTTELRSGEPVDLHDFLLEKDPKYKSC